MLREFSGIRSRDSDRLRSLNYRVMYGKVNFPKKSLLVSLKRTDVLDVTARLWTCRLSRIRLVRRPERGYQRMLPEACSIECARARAAHGKQTRTHGQSVLDAFMSVPGGKEPSPSRFKITFPTFHRSDPETRCGAITPMSLLPISERMEWRPGSKKFVPQRNDDPHIDQIGTIGPILRH